MTGTLVDVQIHRVGGLLTGRIEREAVVDGHRGHLETIGSSIRVELGVTINDLGAIVVEHVRTAHQLDVGQGQVTGHPAIEGVFWRLFVFDLNALASSTDEAVGDVTTGTVPEKETLIVAGAHHRPTVHGGNGEGHLVGGHVAVVRIIPVEFAAAITDRIGLVLDGQPAGIPLATISLVPVKAVVTAEGHECIGDAHRATEELDAIVEVGHHLDVVQRGAASNTTEGEAVDFVRRTEFGSSVADGTVRHGAAVVGVIRTAVHRLIVVGRDALNLGRSSEVGARITEDDHTAPLAARVVRDGTIQWVRFIRKHDGSLRRAIGENLTSLGHDERGSVGSAARRTLDDRSRFDGEGLSRADEDISVEDVSVVGCPGGGSGTPGDLNGVLRHGPDREAEHDKQGENCSHGLVDWLTF